MKYKSNYNAVNIIYKDMLQLKPNDRYFALVNKEKRELKELESSIREGMEILSTQRNIDAIFSNFYISSSKIPIHIQFLVLKGNTIYILENKLKCKNEKKEIKRKVAFFKRLFKNAYKIKYYTLQSQTYKENNTMTFEEFNNMKVTDKYFSKDIIIKIKDSLENKIMPFTLEQYIRNKYDISMESIVNVNKSGKEIIEESINRKSVSIMSTLILCIFILNYSLVFYKITQTGSVKFYAGIALSIFYILLMNGMLDIIETTMKKFFSFLIEFSLLLGFIYIFATNLHYL